MIANANYDRMYMFGDLMNPPFCFVIMTESPTQSRKLMSYCNERIAVGSVFYVAEPGCTEKTLGPETLMPIVTTKHAVVPVHFELKKTNIEKNIPAYELTMPSQTGEQSYFARHSVRISLTRFLLADDVSCTGLTCDRASRLEKNVSCGCSQKMPSALLIVGEYTVQMTEPLEFSPSGKVIVYDCRSYRTT